MLGCAGMADLAASLARRHGLPVIDGVAAAVKLAEALVALGLCDLEARPLREPAAQGVCGRLRRTQREGRQGRARADRCRPEARHRERSDAIQVAGLRRSKLDCFACARNDEPVSAATVSALVAAGEGHEGDDRAVVDVGAGDGELAVGAPAS